jgi:hypothetical protein
VQTLQKNVPFYARLDDADRRELQGHVNVFLGESTSRAAAGWT